MTIEGVPEGWELVRIGAPVVNVDWVVGFEGKPRLCDIESTFLNRVIIRKIEKPKKYRPFNDPAEAEQFLGFPLRLKVDHQDKFVVIGITSHAVLIGIQYWSLQEAFDCFERLDGTPFGIEVTE